VSALGPSDGATIAAIAAEVVRARLWDEPIDGRPPTACALRRVGCSFVTLQRDGSLRGCIGTLEPARPLYRDVARNAGRAMHDPRLPPVDRAEWPRLSISVSVLGLPEVVPAANLHELRQMISPGDGLILSLGIRRATFLPAVWDKLPDPAEFLRALLLKGGWSTHRLPDGMTVRRYTAAEFHWQQ
jgi:AmmeMemoRadiSam system protein A